MPADIPMDFFVPVIDNYGDAGFAYSLAGALIERDPALRVRLVISDPDLALRMAGGSLPRGLSVTPLSEFFARGLTASPSVATFFGYRFPEGSRESSGIRRELRFDYLQFDAGYRRHGGAASIHGTAFRESSTEVTHFVPSWVPGGGGVVLPPLPHESRGSAIRRLRLPSDTRKILEKCLDRPWLSVFCYPETAATVARALQDLPDGRLVLWHIRPDAVPADHHQHVFMPFLPLSDYLRILRVADTNVVRGENSLVASVASGKPTLWDTYRESNGAHEEKTLDYLRNFSDRLGESAELARYSGWQRAFSGDDPAERVAAVRKFSGDAHACAPLFADMARSVRATADIVPRVLQWVRNAGE